MGRGLHSIKWPQPHHHRLKAHDPWPPSERKTRVVPHPHPKTPPPKHHLPPAVSRSPHTIPFVWCSQQFLVPPWSDPSLRWSAGCIPSSISWAASARSWPASPCARAAIAEDRAELQSFARVRLDSGGVVSSQVRIDLVIGVVCVIVCYSGVELQSAGNSEPTSNGLQAKNGFFQGRF